MARANIRQIEAFNAVMKAGSVTGGAALLFVSQPAVTRLLQAFEDACGFPLFDRRPGRLTPTPEARQLFAETETLETGLLRVRRAADAIRNRERGEISVVAFAAIAMQLIPRVVAEALHGRDEVRVTLLVRTSRMIEDMMIAGHADFGLSLLPAARPGLTSTPVTELRFMAAIPAGHPLTSRERISITDLASERIISLGRDDQSYSVTADAFERAGVPLRPVAEVQMAEAATALVSTGYGIALIAAPPQAGPVDPNVVFRPLAEHITMTVWLITPAGTTLSRLAQEVLALIVARLDAAGAAAR
ncbi:LysR family transcriptional regulator [Stappia sp. 22II-S9-Z10]|nr:LysR family transcriptional regulator [Stappia sp. 22II-S9-Z10]